MFIVLRKSSIKRTLAIAMMLIIIGLSLKSPAFTQANESPLYYLYPYPSNNPSQTSLFWSEADPSMGAFSLDMWHKIVPGRQIVVGLPKGYDIVETRGGILSDYIKAKIGSNLKNGSKPVDVGKPVPIPKDSITYERKITSDGIQEKIRVEVGEHFRDNDNFERYLDSVKRNLTNKNELPDRPPVPLEIPEPTPEAAKAVGNTLVLSGVVIMMFKLLPLLAL